MLFKNILTVAATAVVATAEDVYLTVKSDNADINGNSLGYPHEGAGINYFFLGTSAASALTYDSANKTITYPVGSGYFEYFNVDNSFVGLIVGGPQSEITFDSSNTLLLNGTSANFYACKNTGDTYQYSTTQYELMYYTSNAPSGCLALTLVNSQKTSPSGSSSSSKSGATTSTTSGAPKTSTSTAPATTTTTSGAPATTTISTSCTTSSVKSTASTYTGAANHYAPAGALAVLAGAAAALF